MRKFLNLAIIIGLFIGFLSIPSLFPAQIYASSQIQQTAGWTDTIHLFTLLQTLGNNLSGQADTFTFRTSRNIYQFDYLAQNTRLVDNTDSTWIFPCMSYQLNPPPDYGLKIDSDGVPDGYQDVTLDFSCNKYDFIPGHSYTIALSNANSYSTMDFAGHVVKSDDDYFPDGGILYKKIDDSNQHTYNNQAPCSFNDTSGCSPWVTPKDDLYFILTTTPQVKKIPVIFIPGIGGSELKLTQDFTLSLDNGHGGTFNHNYSNNETVWINQNEAIKPGSDDYFDVLKLEDNGETSDAPLGLTGSINSFGYPNIEKFFQNLGYQEGTNFFIYNYDWRKDIGQDSSDLDKLIDRAKQNSGSDQVNIVTHSLGGLIARDYISDSDRAKKVNKLIELGVPHLGTPWALKNLLYGSWLARDFYLFKLGIPPSEIKDIIQNFPSAFELLPSSDYFNFYNDPSLYPIRDDRDIDNNQITGPLDYLGIKSLLQNLNLNMNIFGISEKLQNLLDSSYKQTNSVKLYEIAGSGQPTLGQIRETWWITWPFNLIPKEDETFINGDDTVPLSSATLLNEHLDLSTGANIYYVDQKHGDLPNSSGQAMQIVKDILNETYSQNQLQDQKTSLEGTQISLDNGGNIDLFDQSGNHTGLDQNSQVEENIPNTFYDSLGTAKHIFIKKSSPKVTAKLTSGLGKAQLKIRNYSQDKIIATTFYADVPLNSSSSGQIQIDPSTDNPLVLTVDDQIIPPTSQVTGDASFDQTPPQTTVTLSGNQDQTNTYWGPITITLTSTDDSSGILTTEYTLDNGQTIQTYSSPFIISNPGTYTIQIFSTDKLGNQEKPQTITFTINLPAVNSSSLNNTSGGNNLTKSETNNLTSPQNYLAATPSWKTTSKLSDNNQTLDNLPKGEVFGIQTVKSAANGNNKPDLITLPIFLLIPLILSFLATFIPGFKFGKKI